MPEGGQLNLDVRLKQIDRMASEKGYGRRSARMLHSLQHHRRWHGISKEDRASLSLFSPPRVWTKERVWGCLPH